MDTATAPQPPAAAPAAVPATPAPASALPISSVTGKPISEPAHKLFKMLEEASAQAEVKEEPKETPKETPVAVVEPAKPATPEEKPVKLAKKAPKRPELPKPVAPSAPAVASATPAAVVAPDSDWEDSLIDDEKAALEDARFAEKVNPKHKGLADKMGKFFREQKAYLEKNPDADENDPGYKKILATQPGLTASDKREISAARIAEPIRKEYDSKLTDLQHEIYARDEEPKVKNEGDQIRRHLAFNALPKEILDVLKEKGKAAMEAEYAEELNIAGGIINPVTDDCQELLRLFRLDPRTQRPLSKAAEDPRDPKWAQHGRIAVMVDAACEDFKKNATQEEQVREGKWFVTREEWKSLAPDQRSQYWTFGNNHDHAREIIGQVLKWQPGLIANELKKRTEDMKAKGWEKKRTVAAVATPPPQPTASPAMPRPAPAPAPSTTNGSQLTQGQILARRLSGVGAL